MAELSREQSPDINFMFTKLSVDNLDASAAFYAGVCGLAEMHRLDAQIAGQPVKEVVYLATSTGGPLLVLVKYVGEPAPVAGEVTLGFSTTDLDKLIDRLVAAGGRVLETTQDSYFRTAFALDPEGHKLQFTQPVA